MVMNNWFATEMKNIDQSIEQNCARPESPTSSNLLKVCLTTAALALGLAASAQPITTTTNFTIGAMIPDGDPSGLASVQTISSSITSMTGLKVTVKLSGPWNGDLYCFLTHGAGHAVLLNRVGRPFDSNLGYNDDGFDVTFDDAATNSDIHVYRFQLSANQETPVAGPLTGVWAPDGRVASPVSVLDTDARSAFLSSFNGEDPNGEWILFVADMEAGDIHTLDSWGLEITGNAAPVAP
jgi:subtilisin-like proprotein convertase family protein